MPIDKDRYWMSGLTFVLREQSAIAITLQAFELQLSRGQQFFTPLCPFFDGLRLVLCYLKAIEHLFNA